jgi:hypothetical protein
MNWTNNLNTLCAKFNVEPVITEKTENFGIKKLSFNCPKELAGEEKAAIIRAVPADISSEFLVAPKQSTIGNLATALLLMGTKVENVQYDTATRTLEVTGHGLKVSNTEGEECDLGELLPAVPQDIWDRLSYCLKTDGAIDSWKLRCGDAIDLNLDVKDVKEPVGDTSQALADMLTGKKRDTVPTPEWSEPSPAQPSPKAVKPVDGKSERDNCPTKDEILNLKIALGNAQSIDDILNLM